jgi:hypothetical protein
MSWEDIGAENLKAILRHTLLCTAALLSFIWLGWLTKTGLGDTWLARVIELTESFVLTIVFLMFTVHTICDLYKGVVKNVKSVQFVFC